MYRTRFELSTANYDKLCFSNGQWYTQVRQQNMRSSLFIFLFYFILFLLKKSLLIFSEFASFVCVCMPGFYFLCDVPPINFPSQVVDPQHATNVLSDSTFVDALLGQWWAFILGLGPILPLVGVVLLHTNFLSLSLSLSLAIYLSCFSRFFFTNNQIIHTLLQQAHVQSSVANTYTANHVDQFEPSRQSPRRFFDTVCLDRSKKAPTITLYLTSQTARTHTLTHTHLHSLTHSPTHSITQPLAHSLTHSSPPHSAMPGCTLRPGAEQPSPRLPTRCSTRPRARGLASSSRSQGWCYRSDRSTPRSRCACGCNPE